MLTLHEGLQELEKEFSQARIDTDCVDFYEQGGFIRREQKVPNYFDNYARYVMWQPYSDGYLDRAEQKIHVVLAEMQLALKYDGNRLAFEEAPAVMSRILERADVWSFVVQGALKITFPPQSGYGSYAHCAADYRRDKETRVECGHRWLVAPPFQVIDLAIQALDYPCPCTHLLPKVVARKDAVEGVGEPEEILGQAAREEITKAGFSLEKGLELYLPDYPGRFAADFPAQQFTHNEVEFKYIPTRVLLPDVSLEQFKFFTSNGRSAIEMYESAIKPRLADI